MTGSETEAHRTLKRLALLWAQQHGYAAFATEVRLPNCGYRADVAAYKPDSKVIEAMDSRTRSTRRVRETIVGSTAVFECKQARTDFIRDSQSREPTLARLRKLDVRRIDLERLLKVHHPSLRNGDSLFQEFETFDLSRVEHQGYQKLIREISILKSRLYDKTKFEKLVRYQCANVFYLVVEEGLIHEYESPFGWGLLVRRGDRLDLQSKPIWHDATESNRLALLQRIAIAGTRRFNRECEATTAVEGERAVREATA